jgi:hypothetical protein
MSNDTTLIRIENARIDFDENGEIIIVKNNTNDNNQHKPEYSPEIIAATKLEDERFEGPYECPICHNTYVKKSYWKQHIKSHEHKFECEVCHSKFTHNHHLNQHMIIHEKEKRYACKVCGQKIRFKFNMKKHMKTHIKYFDHNTKTFKYLTLK